MNDLAAVRRFYAEEIRFVGRIEIERLIEAFAAVPREHYLGAGPWRILSGPTNWGYWTTPDADPRHLYHNVLVAIDESKGLNNGEPVWLATFIEAGNPCPGQRVVHIGCGLGYYTALMAELIGPHGSLTAIEVEAELAQRAARNLNHLPQVQVLHTNGSEYRPEAADVIFVNAGVTEIQPAWFESLLPQGRLLVPMVLNDGAGQLLKVTRTDAGYTAKFLRSVIIYPCAGSWNRASGDPLAQAVAAHGWSFDGFLRLDPHRESESCWLHTDRYCLAHTAAA